LHKSPKLKSLGLLFLGRERVSEFLRQNVAMCVSGYLEIRYYDKQLDYILLTLLTLHKIKGLLGERVIYQ
jgi:hypothetical protein